MIREVKGDLLAYDANIICHQTNYFGVMGGGIALAIYDKLLTRRQYAAYQKYCQLHGRGALGEVQFIPLNDGRYLANIFSQDDLSERDVLTDYPAVQAALEKVERFAANKGFSVALPGYIGCGIAGGDWKVVGNIIKQVFGQSGVECAVVYKM